MAQSPEYADLRWMPPKSWTEAARTGVQLVVIHTTEGAARPGAATDGAAYDQRRTDGTSTHFFHDSDATVQCVRTKDQAHTARTQGNRRGVHHELCTRAGSANWSDAYHQAMLARVARQAARDAKKWGIPVRHLTVDQVAAGEKGFCGHVDITRAFPADRGTHTDPGTDFPWSQFLDMVRAEMEDDMTTKAEFVSWLKDPEVRTALCSALVNTDNVIPAPGAPKPGKNPDGTPVNTHWGAGSYFRLTYEKAEAARQFALAANSAIAKLAGKDPVDEKAVAAAVLEGLDPTLIAAAIPAELAQQVANELATRLAS
ncbi:N-acetylmuramoyl-L-alanine amidase [Actinoplanes sp. N902-109]|uniref:peptidoglycan recognition protein family protein n=1 Tax=Actinoplanes sp. (strain N902-109) TaxID=649831 RepID=UPI00032948C1|nr:N-acetylmuramoyl-L-alanine amidase [Actinoplanes sp. N902-109]AGL13887.1 Gp20 [Actinoplanes sp. N902-109]